MYTDYVHANIQTQRAAYGSPLTAGGMVIWLPGAGQSGAQWTELQLTAGASLPWIKWSFPGEASSMLQLSPPRRFIRVEGTGCVEPHGLASAISAVHAMLAQAEAMGISSDRIVIGGFGQGGALALAAGRAYKKPLAGIATLSGWAAGLCAASEANAATPISLCHGCQDATVSHHLLSETAALLRGQHGAKVTTHSIPAQGHAGSPASAALLKQFLLATLPMPSPADSPSPPLPPAPPPPAQSKSVIKMGGTRATAPVLPNATPHVLPVACSPAADPWTPEAGDHSQVRVFTAEGGVRMSEAEGRLTVVVPVPGVASMADLDLGLTSDHIHLDFRDQSSSTIRVDLPCPADPPALHAAHMEGHGAGPGTGARSGEWDTESAAAKFSKKRQELTVTLQRLSL